MRMLSGAATLWLAALAPVSLAPRPLAAADFAVAPVEVAETKALFGRIESRFVVPARSRIGGTLVELSVTEGDIVAAGQEIGRVADDKLELQRGAAEARIAAARSQLQNAETELARNEELLARGSTTTQRVDLSRTQAEVARNALTEAEAAREVVLQQIAEGAIVAPAEGRVLTVPLRLGEVAMPGEPVATIAGGGVFLRLAIPERHAGGLSEGATVGIGDEGRSGAVEKVYPQIEAGRVIMDVAVEGLPDSFIGQRVLVRVPVATRSAIAVPEAAIHRRAGLDFVTLRDGAETHDVTVVPGPLVETARGPLREILSGLRAGDSVVLP
jgi:RND family efflux transporter MFP subunit